MGHIKLIKSGNVVELYEYEKELPIRRTFIRKRKKTYRIAGYVNRRRYDNAGRLKKSFVRLVRSNLVGADRPSLFGFTFAESVSYDAGVSALTLFFKRLRVSFGKGFRYIAVPEFGRRGTKRLHFHAIVWGLPENLILNERNTRLFQNSWQEGFLDCIPTDGSPKLAGYLGKYLFKALHNDGLVGKKAYFCSRNTLRPMSTSLKTVYNYTHELWGLQLSTTTPLQEKFFETQWLGKGRYRRFNLE